jgi:hypothetical protein
MDDFEVGIVKRMRGRGRPLSKQPDIQFDLLTNARDSLKQAVELLALKELGLISRSYSQAAVLFRDFGSR